MQASCMHGAAKPAPRPGQQCPLRNSLLCRALRKRLNVTEAHTTAAAAAPGYVGQGYGVHMAISMAIGFLFLGGACSKFSASSSSVGLLLLSMWPALPASPTDNRCHLQARPVLRHIHLFAVLAKVLRRTCMEHWLVCHVVSKATSMVVLQALRHFYVLAANPRIMRAFDVHVRQPVYVPVTLTATPDATQATRPAPVVTPDTPVDKSSIFGGENVPANAQAAVDAAPKGASDQASGELVRGKRSGLEGLPSAGQSPLLAAAATAGAGGAVTKRLCPCIMPEPHLLQAVEVDGSRYWAQRIDARRHGALVPVRSLDA